MKLATAALAAMIATGAAAEETWTLDHKIDHDRVLEFNAAVVQGQTIYLNTWGGDRDAAEIYVDIIQRHQPEIVVSSDAVCASACVLLLAAADRVTVEPGARIGVHFIYWYTDRNRMQVLWDDTDQMFREMTGSGELFVDYVNYMMAAGLFTAEEATTNFEKYAFTKGGSWIDQSFMYLDHDQLIKYNLISNQG